MRFRKLTVVAVAAIAVTGLTGCDSKVGVAAIIDGHRISDSDVAGYLTKDAQPFPQQDAAGNSVSIAPRVFVLETLLDERVYTDILAATPNGVPTAAQLSAEKQQLFGQSADAEIAKQFAQHGYDKALSVIALRGRLLLEAIKAEAQQGLDIATVLKKVHPDVTVSPRYGAWDAANLQLSSDPGAGVPDFVTLQTPAAPVSAAVVPPTN